MLLFVLTACAVIEVASAGCRPGWFVYGQSCYIFGQSKVTFAIAQTICTYHGATLAEIETAGENAALKQASITKSAEYIWIGGTDIFKEGSWHWMSSDKHISGFSDWKAGQPDNSGPGEDCLTLTRTVNYQWNDLNCDQTGFFICEAPNI